MKKITSFILAFLLIAAMAMPAFATEGESGEEPRPCGHVNKETVITKAATCTESGTRSVICKDCNAVISTEDIPAGHSWGTTRTLVDAATHSMTCSICNATQSEAHTWDQGTVTLEATCTTVGSKTFSCVCGQTKQE